jgi:hypothetical protein
MVRTWAPPKIPILSFRRTPEARQIKQRMPDQIRHDEFLEVPSLRPPEILDHETLGVK